MTSLQKRTRLAGFALALAFALTVLPGLVAPLVGDELASWLPVPAEVSADEAQGGGG